METKPAKNKMMIAPVAKKGWHFPPNNGLPAFYCEADSYEEALKLYTTHFVQSTAPAQIEEEPKAVE